MYEDAHVHRGVINAVEIPLQEGAVIPQAGPDALDRLVNAVGGGLVGVLRLGAIEARPVKVRQVFVVRTGPVTQGLSIRVCCMHRGQGISNELGRRRIPDLFA